MVIHPPNQHPVKDDSLDTLVLPSQSPSEHPKTAFSDDQEKLQKRARSKYFSHPLANLLYAESCKTEEDESGLGIAYARKSMRRAYGRSLDCCKLLIQEADGSLRGHYCNARWCVTCNRIRTAQAIHNHTGWIQSAGEGKYFVTLTATTCKDYELNDTYDGMQSTFTSAKRSIRRGEKMPFEALRKLETTYNWKTDKYHPHYHTIVDGRDQAEALLYYWMQRNPRETDRQGQDIKPVTKGVEKELLKYACKIITDTKDEARSVDPKSLHTIFSAMKGRKTLQPYGYRIKDHPYEAEEGEDALETVNTTSSFKQVGSAVNWLWVPDYHDWVDQETGEILTEYEPSAVMEELVERMKGKVPRQSYPLNEDAMSLIVV